MYANYKIEKIYRRAWGVATGQFLIQLSFFLFFYYKSAASAVALWGDTGAYRHCFLIVPIVIYMIYCDRGRLSGVLPRPSLWGIVVCALFSIAWLAAYEGGIAEGEHFALIGMIEGMILASFGWDTVRRLPLPLLYLFLLVPTGEFLLPPLQRITAVAAGALLDLSGIPTFRDGFLIEIPSGSYMIAPGCAGLNFLLASFALAVAFADLVYRQWGRRLAFIAAMLAIAVAGNAVRVYLIILVAHLTDNIGNIAEDHLLYGWGFFSLLIFGAMAFGHRYHQDPDMGGAAVPSRGAGTGWRAGVSCAVTLAVLAFAPLLATRSAATLPGIEAQAPSLSCGAFAPAPAETGWFGGGNGVDRAAAVDCDIDGTRVHVGLAMLDRPTRQGKLIGLERRLTGSDDWLRSSRDILALERPEGRVWVLSEGLKEGGKLRTLWTVRWVGGISRKPGFDTMIGDFRAELGQHRHAGLLLLMADGPPETASPALRRLLSSMPLPGFLWGDGS